MKRILLIIGGGIAAYKACELVRLIRKSGMAVRCVVTSAGQKFVTPMTLAALSEDKVYTDLFDLKDEAEMGHIQLSRQADLVVVAPATADLMARMAHGLADDLATTLLLATDKPVLAAPAMNGPTPGMNDASLPMGPLRILLAKPTAFFAKLPMLLKTFPILMKAMVCSCLKLLR